MEKRHQHSLPNMAMLHHVLLHLTPPDQRGLPAPLARPLGEEVTSCWAGRPQRVNPVPAEEQSFLLTQCEMGCTKFDFAAVNRKVGRKIGFNKQSIYFKKKRHPQQEMIIWAIVHSVKGLARLINSYRAQCCGRLPPAPCLVSLVTGVALRAEEVCNCAALQGQQRTCQWEQGLAPRILVRPRVAGQNGIDTKGSPACQQKWLAEIIHWPFHLPWIKQVKWFSARSHF